MRRVVQSVAEVWMPQIADLLELPVFVAGGAARWLVMSPDAPEPEDLDLFLFNAEDYRPTVNALVMMGYERDEETEIAAHFQNDDGLLVQLIRPFKSDTTLTYGHPRDVIGRFSFTTEMFAVTSQYSLIADGAREDTAAHLLIVNNITDPLDVAMRVTKYIAKGYVITPEEMLKLFLDWTARPLDYRREVRHQFREAMLV